MGHALLAFSEGMVHGHRQWVGRGAWSEEGAGLSVPCGMVMAVTGCVGVAGGRGMLAVKVNGGEEEEGGVARASGRECRERNRMVSTLLSAILLSVKFRDAVDTSRTTSD